MTKIDNPLILYQKYYDLMIYTYDLTKKFPKSEKFCLVSEIKAKLLNSFSLILYAQKAMSKKEKLKYLHEIDINLKLLKLFVRLSYKYKYISKKNYEVWSYKITDNCNLLGGWIKSCLLK